MEGPIPQVKLKAPARAIRNLLALSALALSPAWAQPAPSKPGAAALCGKAEAIARELSTISGFPLRRAVPCDFITKDKVNEFLKQRIQESTKPEEIRAEELTLKKFGLVPRDFDLAKTTVDLLTEQAAAFYDYDKKKLFVTDTTGEDAQEPVLAHELAHALADQSFNLARFIRQGRQSDDGSSARLAVMEGQATWLMAEYLARRLGQSLTTSPALVAAMSTLSGDASQYPVFANAPLYLRLTLMFPYSKGMLFQDALARKLGADAFAAPFRKPPTSTQQILHPDLYFSAAAPTEPALPDPKLPKSYKPLVGGVMGEFDHAALIEQFADAQTAAALAPHWKGSRFELREDKKAGQVALLYAVEWDSPEAARNYFELYQRGMAKKWLHYRPDAAAPDHLTGAGDGGRFELRLEGSVFTSMEGLPAAIH